MCRQNLSINKVIDLKNIDLLNSYLDGCEATCPHWSWCEDYSRMEQNIRLLDGQAGECACCGEVYNYEDMTKRKTGWYCDRCIRAEESRC